MHYQGGRFDEAEAACRRLLASNPGSHEAWHFLGVMAHQSGQLVKAAELIERALHLEPGNAVYLSNLGEVHRARGHLPQAQSACRRAIALDPELVAAHINLGNALRDAGSRTEAAATYRHALALQPGNALARLNLGCVLRELGQLEQAEEELRILLRLDPEHGGAYMNLGRTLADAGRPAEGEACLHEALKRMPQSAEAYNCLGVLFTETRRLEEAEAALRRAIALRPAYPEAHNNLAATRKLLGKLDAAEEACRRAMELKQDYAEAECNYASILIDLGRPQGAVAHLREALRIRPDFAEAYYNLGVAYGRLGRDHEAEASNARALEIDSAHADARWNLALLHLAAGRFAEGWTHYEARYDPRRREPFRSPIRASFAQWRGEPLSGKALLLWGEQGLGDEIQFVRYAPLLKRMGLRRLTLVCKAPLAKLFGSLEGVDEVLVQEAVAEAPRHDYWSYLLSVPRYLTRDEATVPARLPYLYAAADRLAEWRERLPAEGFRVGLAWKGGSAYPNDARRSLRAFRELGPLWRVPGVSFVSLQIGAGAELERAGELPVLDLGGSIRDFSDTAAIVSQLDLVICVDTALAHLAGALARPCWVLLPSFGTDWRWMRARADSPWYPGVMRLFRQPPEADWAGTIEALAGALRDEVARRQPAP